jgi:serine/threonine-protein kinase
MHPTGISAAFVRDELEKILSSPGFSRSERLSKFLRFVVEEELRGKSAEVKESLVGIEVFGRKPGYDSRQDSVVRTEAAKLRARLSQYYAGDGAADPVVIELPKGGYTPVFRQAEATIERTAPGPQGARPWLGTRLWLTIALVGLALVVIASVWWWVQYKGAPIPIAVLPLTNLSEDPANDYFADGLTGEIIRDLSILDGLAVRSQTSSFAFKGKARNVREAGKQLEVDYILEGSVQCAGRQLRINAQFIRVRDDFPLWSGKFDRELTDVFAIQDGISRGIVNNLRLKLGRGRRRYETSTEAYDLYLRGRALGIERSVSNANRSIGPFEEAIAKDPSFAPAYAGLAQAHAIQSAWFRYDVADEVAKMRAAAEKAIQLDPLLAEAHDALGMAYARDAQWDQSEKSFRRAIELDPGGSMSQSHFALFLLFALGRIDEALQQLRVAEKNDPLSPRVHAWLASVLISAGRYDEAASHCEKVPADYPGSCQGRAQLWQGRTGEALQILETVFNREVNQGDPAWGYLGYAYARAGRREDAEKLAARNQDPFNQAIIFAGLGDKYRTFEALDRAAAVGPVRMGWRLTSPEYALLRGDPRLKALRKKVGLPE